MCRSVSTVKWLWCEEGYNEVAPPCEARLEELLCLSMCLRSICLRSVCLRSICLRSVCLRSVEEVEAAQAHLE